MADTDVDSWYHRKQRKDRQKACRPSASSTVPLPGSDDPDKLARKSPRINGIVRRTELTSSKSAAELRFINPAIYAESLDPEEEEEEEDDEEEREVRIRVEIDTREEESDLAQGSAGDSTDVTDLLSTLSIRNDLTIRTVDQAGDQNTGAQETYRCYSLASPVTISSLDSSTSRSKSVASSRTGRIERRCKIAGSVSLHDRDDVSSVEQIGPEVQRYTLNGHRVVQISTTSFSSTSILEQSVNGMGLARRVAHDEWVRKKQESAQRKREEEKEAEMKKQAEEERLAREKEERESRERECFLKWVERKKKEQEERKARIEKELALQKRLKDIEDKAAAAKAFHLRQWARTKMEAEKARERKLKLKEKKIDEERKRRSEESLKAYEKWREMSKNKPKPATQGLLPHQKAKPAYVNPNPWQGVVDENPVQEDEPNGKEFKTNASKLSSRKSVT